MPHNDPHSEITPLIEAEENRLLYQNISLLTIATIIGSVFIYFFFHDLVDSVEMLQIWMALIFSISLIRLWDRSQYIRDTEHVKNRKIWAWRVYAGSTSAGIVWGLLAWLGFSSSLEYQIVVSLMVIAVASIATSTSSYRWTLITSFLIFSIGLTATRFFYSDYENSYMYALTTLGYMFVVLLSSRNIYRNASNNIRLRLEADIRERELIRTKEEAEQANRAKSDFLSSISHELRTPLSAIIGFTHLVRNDADAESREQKLEKINDAGEHLLNLVNQLLDLSTIERGDRELDVQRTSINDVISECLSLAQPLANKLDIRIRTDAGRGNFVLTDRTALKQIFLNLITNAIKYNVPGGEVKIACEHRDDGLRVNISDTGNGLSDEQIDFIFQAFNRLDETRNIIEGSGIGLSIVKDLAEKMGSEIGVDSTPGEGSTFWVQFTPDMIHQGEETHRIPDQYEMDDRSDDDLDALNILVVEDNKTGQMLIASQLEAIGISYDITTNGREALARLSETGYSLILTDCNMPVMDGYELARRIRDRGDQIPIIGITADAFPESEQRCREAGINLRLVKPVEIDRLSEVITHWTKLG